MHLMQRRVCIACRVLRGDVRVFPFLSTGHVFTVLVPSHQSLRQLHTTWLEMPSTVIHHDVLLLLPPLLSANALAGRS